MPKFPIETQRHSAAHVLAAAVARTFPNAKFGVGPVVSSGFYYDIDIGRAVTDDDLERLESEMKKIIEENPKFIREEMSLRDAIVLFDRMGQTYKVELLKDLRDRGTTRVDEEIATDVDVATPDRVSVYKTGDFVDLCRGPHVDEASDIGVFKLQKVAGAYWRGKETNPQLQRIYGLCFESQQELDAYLAMMEEAAKRDHRKLGKELQLYTIVDEVGPGLPMFYPKGTLLRRTVEDFMMELQESRGYEPIWIPHITKGELYETSGHLEKYAEMYPPMELEGESPYYLKPMNCPHFMMLYKTLPHSYRELPVRYVSTTTNYRYEKSGELSGLTRVRALTQDDCHVFCRGDQLETEISLMLDMIEETYKAFGFEDFWVRVSVHDPENKEKYIGAPDVWEASEAALERLMKERRWEYKIGVGEAAFYGPKLDFIFKDVLGREWQLSTIQLDMNLPKRFELTYITDQGTKAEPIVIHRAIIGSTERFLGILIEHFGGAFPVWLSPVQVKILPVAERHNEFAETLATEFRAVGIRSEVDVSDETVGKKIRNAEAGKAPYMLVVGDKEASGEPFSVRSRGERDQFSISKEEFIVRVQNETASRT